MQQDFIDMLASMGDSRFDSLPRVLEETAPEVAVRLNPRKKAAIAEGTPLPDGEKVEWCEQGRYLTERPKFTFDPLMHQGAYYVQDPSSMIMGAVAAELSDRLSNHSPILWLDACAAPGGKTTAAIDALPDGSLVVANEYDFQRAEILKENVAKWGTANTVVTRGDTAQFTRLPELFDIVAVDAPCSGEGMMRKDPVARQQWTPALVTECAARQREILGNLWEALRPGGYLVYSTCTFNTTENEEMARWIIDTFDAVPVDLNLPYNIDGAVSTSSSQSAPTLPALRFIPGRVRGEGLFLCVLQKPGDAPGAFAKLSEPKKAKKQKGKPAQGASPSREFADFVNRLSPQARATHTILQDGTALRAFPSSWLPLLGKFEKTLNIIAKGVELAEIKGRDLVPTQAYALSGFITSDAFPTVEVSRQDALRYLSRETISLPDDAPRGYLLLTYATLPLGFVKNLGNRSNNLYPKEWRIKSKL